MNTAIITIVAILILWSLIGYFSSRVETAEYSVLESKDGYELRIYPSHIVAQTVVTGTYDEALRAGFRIIASYIFGGNTKKESIAMTSPVIEKNTESEKITMTSPVMATIDGKSHTIAFGMPKTYSLETLPVPNDSRVQIVTIPEKKLAVLRFTFTRGAKRVQSKKEELVTLIKKDGLTQIGEVEYAGYNAPWTPLWMTRNEVMVEVK